MGMSPQELAEAEPRIIELAGIGKAIHRPMNTYSAGMRTRLLFAINTACRPEILLIDEALGTGDRTFAARANKMMEEMLEASGRSSSFPFAAAIRDLHARCLMHNTESDCRRPNATGNKAHDDWAKHNHRQEELASQMLNDYSSYRPARRVTMGH